MCRAYQIASQLTRTLTNLTLPPFAMSFQVFNGTMALIWATICIYRLERNWFYFSLYENPLYNFFVLHFVFSSTLKTLLFIFLQNFGSLDEIFGISLRGLCDWTSVLKSMTASEKSTGDWWRCVTMFFKDQNDEFLGSNHKK